MAQVFFRKKFSYYLGEQRALGDIVEIFTAPIQPTPTPTPTTTPTQTITPTITPTSQTPTPTPTPTATPGIGNPILTEDDLFLSTEDDDNINIE